MLEGIALGLATALSIKNLAMVIAGTFFSALLGQGTFGVRWRLGVQSASGGATASTKHSKRRADFMEMRGR